jgi:nitroimidazol reductase NimA-like FMN-containing flavoprotein (pyridoxamine 5'-phosphate oxidase superfamily)
MRRNDRRITNLSEIEDILARADACRIALVDEGMPYLVALNYGYRKATTESPAALYFHCAPEGRKLDIIRKNNQACFQLDVDHELIRAGTGCGWGMKFRSVVGFGRIVLVEDEGERKAGLDAIMQHYGAEGSFAYEARTLALTTVLRLDIEEISAKKKG